MSLKVMLYSHKGYSLGKKIGSILVPLIEAHFKSGNILYHSKTDLSIYRYKVY